MADNREKPIALRLAEERAEWDQLSERLNIPATKALRRMVRAYMDFCKEYGREPAPDFMIRERRSSYTQADSRDMMLQTLAEDPTSFGELNLPDPETAKLKSLLRDLEYEMNDFREKFEAINAILVENSKKK